MITFGNSFQKCRIVLSQHKNEFSLYKQKSIVRKLSLLSCFECFCPNTAADVNQTDSIWNLWMFQLHRLHHSNESLVKHLKPRFLVPNLLRMLHWSPVAISFSHKFKSNCCFPSVPLSFSRKKKWINTESEIKSEKKIVAHRNRRRC